MTPYFIGLDIGTTSSKAVAFDRQGNTLSIASVPYPTLYPTENQAVQQPEVIWQAVKEVIKKVLASINPSYQLEAVGLSSAMHSIMAIDSNGTPISDLMIWSDNRAADVVEEILDTEGDIYYESVGVPLHPMTPFGKLLWIKKHEPDLLEKAYKFIGIKEWIWYKLTGYCEIDFSIAGATGMLNIHNLDWHQICLEELNISANKLPNLIDTSTIRKCINSEIFQKDTKIIIGASDGCLANLGAGAMATDTLAVTIGTSAAARVVVPKPYISIDKNTFCYYLTKDKYVVGGGSNSGGIIIEWFVKNFAQNNYDLFYEWVAHTAVGAEGVSCIPYLQGERAPVWDSAAVGIFYGLKIRHKPTHLARAIVEGILLNIRQIIESIDIVEAKNYKSVKVGGGSSVSPVILQLLADVLGVNVEVTSTTEHSAWGATLIAMYALGIIKNLNEIDAPKATHIFIPNINTDYDKQIVKFKKIYEVNKTIYQK